MDISQTISDTENALRDFISIVLEKKFGADWIDNCGVTGERINQWKARQEEENSNRVTTIPDTRLIYYSDFSDLRNIICKNWDPEFREAFGDQQTLKVNVEQLINLRNPTAHSRELLPHQKDLASGICGEIRTQIVRYRSKLDDIDEYFPRIEFVQDSFGNSYDATSSSQGVITKSVLRPGDDLSFTISARDPMDRPLEYCLYVGGSNKFQWSECNSFTLTINEAHIGKIFLIELLVKNNEDYRARGNCDDNVRFFYSVIPKR